MGPHCRYPRRTMAVLVFVGLIGLVFLALHMVDILGQYRTYDYVFELLRDPVVPSSDIAAANLRPESDDKIIVVAKLEKEETDWIKEFLPEYEDPCNHSKSGISSNIFHATAGRARFT